MTRRAAYRGSVHFLRWLRGVVLGGDLDVIIERLNRMASSLDNLKAAVENEGTVIQSAIVLIQGLKTQLDAAGTDPQKLNELSTQLKSQADSLAAAVAANTPAVAPAPVPVPAPSPAPDPAPVDQNTGDQGNGQS